tara:strand:- start:332 stop:658 length:327 start_codon:yes stop_codon:yes gene_type:complete
VYNSLQVAVKSNEFNNNREEVMTTTIKSKVLTALQSGRTLSSAQLRSQFGAGNPQSVIQSLRFEGFPIYLNTVSDTKGRTRNVYRLGTPSRAVIAAGYQALASGTVTS